jgi:hypothetical protein
MISPTPSSTGVVHLIAPPSSRRISASISGRSIPTLLLSLAIKNNLTPPPPQSRVISVGDSSSKAAAAQLGIQTSQHIAPLLAGKNNLKRQLIKALRYNDFVPSRILCWSDELIAPASAAAAQLEIPIELISTKPDSLTTPPQNIDTIRVFESSDHDIWQSHRHTCQTDHLLTPLLDPQPPTPDQRASCRQNLDIDNQTICIAAVADNPADVDAREFAFLLGLLAVSGYQTLGIVPSTAMNLNQALRHHRGLDEPFRIMTTTETLPQLIPLLDAYIHPTDEISGSTQLLDRYLERADVPKLNLRHSGKAGFSRAQGSAGQLLDEMDAIVERMKSTANSPQPAHA